MGTEASHHRGPLPQTKPRAKRILCKWGLGFSGTHEVPTILMPQAQRDWAMGHGEWSPEDTHLFIQLSTPQLWKLRAQGVFLALPFTSCVPLNKLFNLSGPQYPHL